MLVDEVEIWIYRPEPIYYRDGDVTWIAPLDIVDRKLTYYGCVSYVVAKADVGNGVPTSERECLRVERGPRAAS